jgi:hypothetical protein
MALRTSVKFSAPQTIYALAGPALSAKGVQNERRRHRPVCAPTTRLLTTGRDGYIRGVTGHRSAVISATCSPRRSP